MQRFLSLPLLLIITEQLHSLRVKSKSEQMFAVTGTDTVCWLCYDQPWFGVWQGDSVK